MTHLHLECGSQLPKCRVRDSFHNEELMTHLHVVCVTHSYRDVEFATHFIRRVHYSFHNVEFMTHLHVECVTQSYRDVQFMTRSYVEFVTHLRMKIVTDFITYSS